MPKPRHHVVQGSGGHVWEAQTGGRLPDGECKVFIEGLDDFAAALERFGLDMSDFEALNPWGVAGRHDDNPDTPFGRFHFPWPPPDGETPDSSTETNTMSDDRTPEPGQEPATISETEAERILQAYDPHVAAAFRRATAEQKANILGLFQRVREGAPDADQELRQEATTIQTNAILSAGRRERPEATGETARILKAGRPGASDDEGAGPEDQARRIMDAGKKPER